MALLRQELTRAQHRSHTRRVCECQLFLRSVLCDGISSLDQRSSFIHYLSRQVKFYSLSFHMIGIKRLFQRNKLLCYLERCPFTEYVGYSQQHKYLKHGGREPVASKEMMLGQVVPNGTGQVVSSKILRIFRWKLWLILCSVPLSKCP